MNKKRIFKRKVDFMQLYIGGIELVDKKNIDKAQLGYRCHEDGKINEEWIGESFYVIGFDILLGDPIIVKVDEESYPVYSMMHDDWSNLNKIANSYEDFIIVLGILNNAKKRGNLNDEKTILKIKEIISKECVEYWDSFLQTEIEYLEEN